MLNLKKRIFPKNPKDFKEAAEAFRQLSLAFLEVSKVELHVGVLDGHEQAGSDHASDPKKRERILGGVPITDYSFKITLGEVSFIHELGYSPRNIPRRSFLESTLQDFGPTLEKKAQRILMRQIDNGVVSFGHILEYMGKEMQKEIKRKFDVNNWPPLKDPTRQGRTSNGLPLKDTLQLKNSITWNLVYNSKEKALFSRSFNL